MKKLLCLALLLSVSSCGKKAEDPHNQPARVSTPYGSPEEVTQYLVAIDPMVREMSSVQREVDQAIGSSGQATGKNLAPVMEKSRPRLQAALEQFEKITPPPLLAPFHQKIKTLMITGLDAYATTIKGWQLEQEKNDLSLYAQAEAKLAEAKNLSMQLNEEMQKIQQALVAAVPQQQTVVR